jgi:hypothetical protein
MASCRNVIEDEVFNSQYFMLSMVFESIFFTYMVLKFFKEYAPKGGGDRQKPIREWGRIISNYVTSDFLFDFVPLIPF